MEAEEAGDINMFQNHLERVFLCIWQAKKLTKAAADGQLDVEAEAEEEAELARMRESGFAVASEAAGDCFVIAYAFWGGKFKLEKLDRPLAATLPALATCCVARHRLQPGCV